MRNNLLITLIIRKTLVFCVTAYYKRMMLSEEMMEAITQTSGRVCKHGFLYQINENNGLEQESCTWRKLRTTPFD